MKSNGEKTIYLADNDRPILMDIVSSLIYNYSMSRPDKR